MTNLKPCPFCGGEPKLMQAWVECKKCRAMAAVSGTRNEAIAAWNRRFGSDINVGRTEDGWVSVDDRLPERDVRVLAYSEIMSDTEAGIQIVKGWMCHNPKTDITHWMPLPPEGGAE